jgi:uncharacterized protein YcbK (DUF882 family)
MRLTTSLRDNIIIFAGENRQMRGTAMGDLSAHFSKAELACRCCGELSIEQGLIDALEQLRSLAGTEVLIHDGYRCPPHNQEVGGVTDSEHTRGLAADVGIPGLSLQQMYELALQIPTFAKGGIGVYDGGFLHLDVRPYAARWARVRGQYVGIQHLVKPPLTLLAKVRSSSQPG